MGPVVEGGGVMMRKLGTMGQLNRREFLTLTSASATALFAAPDFLSTAALAGTQKKTIWFATLFHSDAPAMDMIIKKFNAAQGEIEVDLTQGSWTEYYAQLYNSVVAGKAPQIAICHDWRIAATHPILVALNQSPAGNLLEKVGFNKNDYIPYAWAASEVGGNRYGIPLDQHMYGIYYNKKLFRDAGLDPERPPDTLQQFEAAANALKEKTGKYAYHPGAYGQARWYRRTWYVYLWQNGGKLLEGNAPAFNDAKGIEALEYLVSRPI
jgi:multiple sugar transport system substrate-binding protein